MAVFILHAKYAQTVHVSITQTSRIFKSNGGMENQTHKRASEQTCTTNNKKQTHHIAHWKLSNISFTPNNPRSKTYFGCWGP